MSHRDRFACEKSHRVKSFQHMRDSDRSMSLKLTRSNAERPKCILGSVRPDRSASSQSVRKKAMFTGASSSKPGLRGGRWGAPSGRRGMSWPRATNALQDSSSGFRMRVVGAC